MAFFMFFPILAQAAEPLRVTWQQVPSVCSGRIALVRLTTDTRLVGRILSVAATSFDMEVERTSDKKAAPKGIRTLDRSALVELRVRDKRIRGRVIGALAGLMATGPIVYSMSAGVVAAIGLPVYVGIIAVGHLAGQSFDHKSRVVEIQPDGGESEDE